MAASLHQDPIGDATPELPGIERRRSMPRRPPRVKHGESLKLLRFKREQVKVNLLQARLAGDHYEELRYNDELELIDRRIKRRDRNLALQGHDVKVSKFEAMQFAIHKAKIEKTRKASVALQR